MAESGSSFRVLGSSSSGPSFAECLGLLKLNVGKDGPVRCFALGGTSVFLQWQWRFLQRRVAAVNKALLHGADAAGIFPGVNCALRLAAR
jgi:hypothetical protein